MLYIVGDEGLANFAIESLKQLQHTAGGNVRVAAQVDLEGSGEERKIRRYKFTEPHHRSIEGNEDRDNPVPHDTDMTDPGVLADFITYVRQQPDLMADHYCLILWGHGPELLYEVPTTRANGKGLYFTPLELRDELKEAKEKNQDGKKLDIIGMDACSMSMIEYAYELKGLAEFMVASQEEVPDQSFPYDTLVARFRQAPDTETLCKDGVEYYWKAYEDYVCTDKTGMKSVTLSCLQLDKISTIAKPLEKLAGVLREVAEVREGEKLILDARKNAKGFAGGIFVDIASFCEQLLKELSSHKLPGDMTHKLRQYCDGVRLAIQPPGDTSECIIANKTRDKSCHGLSIYFPYLSDGEKKHLEGTRLIKTVGGPQNDTVKTVGGPQNDTVKTVGGPQNDTVKTVGGPQNDTVKTVGGPQNDTVKNIEIANLAARNIQYAVRRTIIQDTEAYYNNPKFEFRNTGWFDFIAYDWCRILVENEPKDLDLHHSAQQCAHNLLHAAQATAARMSKRERASA
jgi:hypothetical protein